MRIGILSDIHGNRAALDVVRQDLERRGTDRVINLGDVAFRGPAPLESLQAVREMGAPVLLGNTEVWLTQDEVKLPPALMAVRKWTRARLRDEDLAEMASYPESLRMEVDGRRLLFVHGSPRGNMDSLFPAMSNETLLESLDGCEADVVLCGHTHNAFSRRVGNFHLIGVGSVGLSFDGDPRASYALLDITPGEFSLTQIRLDYDSGRTLALAVERSFPDTEFLTGALTRGTRE